MSVPEGLWRDQGEISQGKIITAILRREDVDAKRMLKGWSVADLMDLERAAEFLSLFARQEIARRSPR